MGQGKAYRAERRVTRNGARGASVTLQPRNKRQKEDCTRSNRGCAQNILVYRKRRCTYGSE